VENLKSLQKLGFKDIILADLCPNSGLRRSADSEQDIGLREERYFELVAHVLQSASCIEEIPEMTLRDCLKDLKYGARRYFCCDTGRHLLYLDPDEDFYPCFRLMTPDTSQRVGSLDLPPRPESLAIFYETNVMTTQCFACWARYLCGGPCFGNAFVSHGDFSTPDPGYCRHQKLLLYCAAYLLDHYRMSETMVKGDKT